MTRSQEVKEAKLIDAAAFLFHLLIVESLLLTSKFAYF